MAVVSLLSESMPPTASSRPCSEAHVGRVTGVSASWCHALDAPVVKNNATSFTRALKDCGWQDRSRADSEIVKTNLDHLPF